MKDQVGVGVYDFLEKERVSQFRFSLRVFRAEFFNRVDVVNAKRRLCNDNVHARV